MNILGTISRRQLMTILGGGALLPTPGSVGCSSPRTGTVKTPDPEDLIFMSASTLASAIRARQVSSEEVIQAHILRIQDVNSKINAVVQLVADRALDQARKADEDLARGEPKGPLHGVPVTFKDSLDTAGVVSTGGTKGRQSFIPKRTQLWLQGCLLRAPYSSEKQILRSSLFGEKPTTSSTDVPTTRMIFPRLRAGAAEDQRRSLLLEGLRSISEVTQEAASECPLTAAARRESSRLRSSPSDGPYHPVCYGLADSLTQIGPMARCVEDLILALPLIVGPDWQDPAIVGMPLGDPRTVALKDLRVAFHVDNGIVTPIPEIVDAVKKQRQS